jgi:hypothetical protein
MIEAERQARVEAEEKAKAYAEAKTEMEKKLQDLSKARTEAEQKLQAEIQARQRAEQKAEAEAQEREKAQAKAQALTGVKSKTQEKSKAESEIRAKFAQKLKAEFQKRAKAYKEFSSALDLATKARVEIEARIKTERQARIKAEEKAKAYAEAKTKAEKKLQCLARARDEAKQKLEASNQARSKAEQIAAKEIQEKNKILNQVQTHILAQAESVSRKQHKPESENTEVTKPVNKISDYVFHIKSKQKKYALVSALLVISAIALTIRLAKEPPLIVSNATTIPEEKAEVKIDAQANNINTNNDTEIANGTNASNDIKIINDTEIIGDISSINPPLSKVAKLTVLDGYNQTNGRSLLANEESSLVRFSDDERLAISYGSYIYNLSNVYIPLDTVIKSVIVYVEHFEEDQFEPGQLMWSVGTGWPAQPVLWAELSAPVHEGESFEVTDSWDLTTILDTPEKVNSFQLEIKNNDNIANRKTLLDSIHAVVDWDWKF